MSNLQEIWLPLLGHEENYSISSLGRIKWIKSGQILSLTKHSFGYRMISINGKMNYVHRLVASTFILNPKNKPIVNHIDGDPSNNKVENLEWTDQSKNISHAVNINPNDKRRGQFMHTGKLDPDNVLQIVELSKTKKANEIARAFGVDRTSIQRILRGECWSYVTGIPRKLQPSRIKKIKSRMA